MKKVFSVFFLLLILLQSGGMVWLFKLKQISIRYQMSELVNESLLPLETIVMSEKEYLECVREDGEEIKWKGELFDVKSTSIQQGKITLRAMRDSQEDALILHFAHFIKHSGKNQKHRSNSVAKILLLCCIVPSQALILEKPFLKSSFTASGSFASKTFHSSISSPPPELIS